MSEIKELEIKGWKCDYGIGMKKALEEGNAEAWVSFHDAVRVVADRDLLIIYLRREIEKLRAEIAKAEEQESEGKEEDHD